MELNLNSLHKRPILLKSSITCHRIGITSMRTLSIVRSGWDISWTCAQSMPLLVPDFEGATRKIGSILQKRAPWTSLTFLLSRSDTWRRWVANYNERTKVRINLFFNLAAQSDSRTNLEIANLTSKISIETQRNSSSMIT